MQYLALSACWRGVGAAVAVVAVLAALRRVSAVVSPAGGGGELLRWRCGVGLRY